MVFAAILPGAIAAAEAPVGDHEAVLFPEEAACIARAVASRRREFATGRLLARDALRALGGPAVALPVGERRQPLWPAGFTGCITHTEHHAAAAVGRLTDAGGLGIDLEIVSRMSWSLAPKIATPAEREALAATADPVRLLALLFSAKEAWFKCQYPLTRRYLDFGDAEIAFDHPAATFVVHETNEIARRASGRYAWSEDAVATAIVLAPA